MYLEGDFEADNFANIDIIINSCRNSTTLEEIDFI
jgi:hypothetical protein